MISREISDGTAACTRQKQRRATRSTNLLHVTRFSLVALVHLPSIGCSSHAARKLEPRLGVVVVIKSTIYWKIAKHEATYSTPVRGLDAVSHGEIARWTDI